MRYTVQSGARIPHPVVPHDPFFAKVGYLLHFDDIDTPDVFPDVLGNIWARGGIFAVNSYVSSDNQKFGLGSLRIREQITDAPSCNILASVTPYVMSPTNTLTVEGWVYWSGDIDAQIRVGAIDTTISPVEIELYVLANIGVLRFDATFNSLNTPLTTPMPSLQWCHVAGTYDGTTKRLFLNGSLVASAVIGAGTPKMITGYRIGYKTGAPPQIVPSFVDECRFTFDVCRYTANFTPPTAPFPNTL
jgi:hypothetical protein